jgi:hypothetical protein
MPQTTSKAERAFEDFLKRAAAGATRKRSRKQVEAWHKALEAERFDISYRRVTAKRVVTDKAPATKPAQPTAADYVARIKRDRVFYDAGRFAAGARDEQAIKAFEAVNRRETN